MSNVSQLVLGLLACVVIGAVTGLWAVRECAFQVEKNRFAVTSRTALRRWIAQHMPELDAELGTMSLDQVRIRLNAITGCTVGPADSVELGSAVFLAALKAQDGAWRTEA